MIRSKRKLHYRTAPKELTQIFDLKIYITLLIKHLTESNKAYMSSNAN